jgi:uncharacterized protein (DUF302 family)
MQRFLKLLSILMIIAAPAQALEPREGWVIHDTGKSFADLVQAVRDAVSAAPIAIVTQASASDGARMQGHSIPGNRVFGLYRNDYARRMLAASIAAGIEAPIRMYVTEDADGTATLSYKTPSAVFSPYFDEGGDALRGLAEELDAVFEGVARAAVAE